MDLLWSYMNQPSDYEGSNLDLQEIKRHCWFSSADYSHWTIDTSADCWRHRIVFRPRWICDQQEWCWMRRRYWKWLWWTSTDHFKLSFHLRLTPIVDEGRINLSFNNKRKLEIVTTCVWVRMLRRTLLTNSWAYLLLFVFLFLTVMFWLHDVVTWWCDDIIFSKTATRVFDCTNLFSYHKAFCSYWMIELPRFWSTWTLWRCQSRWRRRGGRTGWRRFHLFICICPISPF